MGTRKHEWTNIGGGCGCYVAVESSLGNSLDLSKDAGHLGELGRIESGMALRFGGQLYCLLLAIHLNPMSFVRICPITPIADPDQIDPTKR